MFLIRFLFMYAAPIWFPNASPSLTQKLHNIQNSALRTATGCVNMTSIDHLHEETKMLPISKITFPKLAPNISPELSNLTILQS